MTVLPCFMCGAKLLPAFKMGGGPYLSPARGTIFKAAGNYGSTLFDDEPDQLLINICDQCLASRAKDEDAPVQRLHPIYKAPEFTVETWLPLSVAPETNG